MFNYERGTLWKLSAKMHNNEKFINVVDAKNTSVLYSEINPFIYTFIKSRFGGNTETRAKECQTGRIIYVSRRSASEVWFRSH